MALASKYQQLRVPSKPPASKPALGGTFGVIALAFGLGVLGAYTLDGHGHRCDRCGRSWWHLGVFNVGDKPAHTCKSCGAEQWWKSSVPAELRHPYDAFAHDALLMPPSPGTRPSNPVARPSIVAPPTRALDETPTIASADSTALVAWGHGRP